MSVGEFVEQAGEFAFEGQDSSLRNFARARAWRDLNVTGRQPRWAATATAAIGDLVYTVEVVHLADKALTLKLESSVAACLP